MEAQHAYLSELADTHPPFSSRLHRIRHLSDQLAMLQRATAAAGREGLPAGPASGAEQVARHLH